LAASPPPFNAEEGEFIHPLRSGEIASVAVGHSADFYATSGLNTNPFNAQDDIAVSWVNRFGLRREAILNEFGGFAQNAQGAQATRTPKAPRPPHLWIHRPPSS